MSRRLHSVFALVATFAAASCRDFAPTSPQVPAAEQVQLAEETRATYWGPVTLERTTGEPMTVELSIPDTDLGHFDGGFVLHVRNGDEDGNHRVSAATIRLGTEIVVRPAALSQSVSQVQAPIAIGGPAQLSVRIASKPGSRLTLWIEGRLKPGHGLIGSQGGVVTHPGGAIVTVLPDSFETDAWVVIETADDNQSAGLTLMGQAFEVNVEPVTPSANGSRERSALTSSFFSYIVHLPTTLAVTGALEAVVALTSALSNTFYGASTWVEDLPGGKYLAVQLRQAAGTTARIQVAASEALTCRDQYKLFHAGFDAPSNQRTPVVFVHGWQPTLGNCASWRTSFDATEHGQGLLTLLDNDDTAEFFDFWRFTYPTFNSISEAAESLAANIERQFPSGNVVIIGHSMGGLVARAAVEQYGVGNRATVITMAAPHAGSQLADPPAWTRVVTPLPIGFVTSYILSTPGARDLRVADDNRTNFIARLADASDPDRLRNYYTLSGTVSAASLDPCGAGPTSCTGYLAGLVVLDFLGHSSDGVVPVSSARLPGSNVQHQFGTGYDHTEMARGNFDGTDYPCTGAAACMDPVFRRISEILLSLIPPAAPHALLFNGTSAYVTVPSSPSLGVSALTAEAWIRLSSNVTAGAQARIVNRQTTGTGGESWGLELFGVGRDGATGNEVVFHAGNCTTHPTLRSGFNLQVGRWYHVAGTNDGIMVRIFVDGQQVASAPSHGPSCTTNNGDIVIGRTSGFNSFFFPGTIDEVRFWGTARTQAQIAGTMLSAVPANSPSLVAYWKFDEGSGSVAHDATGHGHNGTLISNPQWVTQDWPSPAPATFRSQICGTQLDFDQAQLPAGWNVSLIRSGPGLVNNRLEGRPVDSGADLIAPSGAAAPWSGLEVNYEASNLSTFWGMHHELRLVTSSGLVWFLGDVLATFNYGANNLAYSIGSGPGLNSTVTVIARRVFPFQYGNYRYRVVLVNGSAAVTITSMATGQQLASFTESVPGFDPSQLVGLHFRNYTTTDNATWTDNLSFSCN